MGHKSPEEELEEFLAEQPSWMQKVLEWNFPLTPQEASAFAEYGFERLAEHQEQYETLASRVPARWREYRKRRRQAALAGMPEAKPGRPRKDSLAEEARRLQSGGKSYSEIAAVLRDKYATMTPKGLRHPTKEGIRKLLGSRKHRPTPDKT